MIMRKRRNLRKKIAAALLALCVGLLPAISAMPPITALAAENDVPEGTLHFTVVDSTVYGADRTNSNIETEMLHNVGTEGPQAFQDYWADSLTNYDFLYTPQGLATFFRRNILIFDVTKLNDDGTVAGKLAADNGYGSAGYYSYKHLTETLHLTAVCDHTFVGGEFTFINSKDPDGTVRGNATWAQKNHYYVIIEKPDDNASISGYYVNAESNSKGWQCEFQWTNGMTLDLSYNEKVASNYKYSEPLHNEVMRGGFSFNVYDKDLNKFSDQAAGKLASDRKNVVFAVYNISSSAGRGTDGRDEDKQWSNNGTTTGGYVIADRDNNNTISMEESQLMIPAYSESEVISAYKEYLQACRDHTKTENGETTADPLYNGNMSDYMSGDGEFIIGTNNAGKPIIPVMLLRPDENGVVETSPVALPVGNYIVLQVNTAKGYYIDEDFRPIISMGPWFNNDGKQVTGFGNAYWPAIDDTIALSYAAASNLGVIKTTNPVAFCTTGANSVTKLSSINASQFYVSEGGGFALGTGNPGNNGPVYAKNVNGPSGGKYIMNSTDPRMKPVTGNSKFNAYNAIVRGGTKVYLADSDDLDDAANKHVYASKNIGSNGDYLIIPQGNGKLNGAEFMLVNLNAAPMKLYTTGGMLNPSDYDNGIIYTVANDMLLIPVDDLAYGNYAIVQRGYGEGYSEDETFKPYRFWITDEDQVNITFTADGTSTAGAGLLDEHTVRGRIFIPNQIVNGGEIFSLASNSAEADKSVTISVYNISDHYVYVDKDGDGEKERYETYQSTYAGQIANKSLSREKLVSIVNSWTPCSVQTVNVGNTASSTDKLPYGTYLVVATGVPVGYDVIGEYMKVDSIDNDDDNIVFATRIENENTIPRLSTTFLEAESKLDSVPIKNRVFFEDQVQASNLKGGTTYALYGVIADSETGDILKQGCVAYTTFTAYSSTDDGGGQTAQPTGGGLDYLVTKGGTITGPGEEAVIWGTEVKNYAETVKDNTLAKYCDTFLTYAGGGFAGAANPDISTFFTEYKNLIMGHLRYLGGGISGNDTSLDGTGSATVLFNWIDTTGLEGKDLIAYEYLCEAGSKADEDALLATNTGQILAVLDLSILAIHKDMLDEEQTAHAPSLDITAEARYTGLKVIDSSEDVKATVQYGNLEIGNDYAIRAWLVDEYGNEITYADLSADSKNDKAGDGGRYELEEQIHAYSSEGSIEFDFEGLDMEKYNGQRLTAYATLYRSQGDIQNKEWWLVEKGDADSMHYSITDEEPGKNQVDVSVPTIKTVLADKYGNKEVDFDAKASLVDTVSYKNLIPGASYKSVLTLVNKDGAKLLDDDGNELTAGVEFTADGTEKEIQIPIEFNGKDIQGIEIVAYNDLYKVTKGHVALVAQEHNVNASDQTITATGADFRIVISTVALDDNSRTHIIPATGEATATESVNIKRLEPSTKYVTVTELADAKTGNVLTQFAPVETEFTTDTDGNAKFDVPILFNASVFQGKSVVVYETVYDEKMNNVIAEHKNKNDANQTLKIPFIDTVATANDGVSKKIVPDVTERNMTNAENSKKEKVYTAEIMDTITYTNLIPGNTYRITTEIVSRDGKGSGNGSSVGTTTTEFTPTSESGTTVTYLTVDVTKYQGAKLVVYETVTDVYSETVVIEHKDITDEDQTVQIVGEDEYTENPNDPDDPDNPDKAASGKPGDGTDIQTGVSENYMLFFIIAGLMVIGCAAFCGVYLRKRRKRHE